MDNLRYEDPSGILFNKVKAPLTLFEKGPLGKKDRISINGADVTDIDLEKAFVNAVDIDWNGAEVDSNTEINTTGELLAWIKSKIGSGEDTPEELPITVSFTFNCYRWYLNDVELPQAPLDSDEDEPSPSDYIGDSSKALPTNKWSKYSTNRPDVGWYLWLSSTIRTLNVSDGTITTGNWSTPVRISGLDGTPGEDSTLEEWIYKVYTTELDFSTNGDNPASWEIVDLDDYTGTWSDNPPGVSINFPFEYKSFRKKLNGHWGKFSGPVLNGHYGINGNDGDGVEYVFARTTKDFPPIIKNDPYNTDKLSYNVDEFLPLVYVNNSDNRVSGSQFGDTGNVEDKCTDNPVGVNSVWKYEWVLKRKKTSNDHDGNREWEPYTGNLNPETGEGYMAKWATFSQNGIDGDTPIIEIIDGYWFINGTNTGVKAEGSDGSSGVLVVDYCPDGADEYSIGTMANCQGHIKLKTASGWIDLGESSGTGSYTHIAYATWVTISNGVVTDVTGFTVSNANGTSYPWVGFYSNDEETDPGKDASSDLDKLNAAKLYKWNYVKGMDGNGVEWIYTMSKGTKPTINLDNGQGTKTEDEFFPLIANYQANQFWSLYWSDDPPAQVSPEWTNRWKAQRKKVNGVWSTFGNVVDDGTYTVAESVYTITSDNDVFILDDLTVDSATIIESSRANVGLSYGTVPYNGNYTLELPNNLLNLPNGLIIMPNPNNNRQLYVTVENGANLSILPVGAYYYYVQAVVDNVIVALRRFNFYIKNITADGSVYKLVILNDSLSFTGEGTRISTEAPKAIILKIKNGVPQNISNENLTLYSGNSLPQSNIPSGLILLYPSSMSTSGNIITTNTSKLLNFNPINYSAGGYELTLYYGLTEGNTIIPVIVDSEHIDCLKDGTDGKDGVVSGYTLNCDNDNVIVDDNTVSGFNILAKSLLTLKTTEEQFPNNISLEIDTSGISFVKTSNETKSGAIFQISASPVGNTQTNTSREYLIEFTSIQNPLPSTLTLGSYSIIYKAVDGSNNVLILKKQNIHVDDFSMGESYKLVVTPNSISCDSEGNIKSGNVAPNISYLKINGADSVEQITNPTNSSSVNVGDLYIGITPDNVSTYSNGNITFSSQIDSDISKLTVNLYLKISISNSIIVDSEDIDIIRDGANGTRGKFRSTVFCRTNDPLNTLLVNSQTGKSTIAGGTYTNPIPNNTLYRYNNVNKSISWSDGVPSGTDLLWSTSAIFEDINNFTPEWSIPAMQADSDVLDIEFSPNESYNPLGDTPYADRSNIGWYDPSKHTNVDWSTMIWRAERKVKNGVFVGDWVITRIKGENGTDGQNGHNGENGLDAENQWTIWAEPNIIILNLLVDGNGFVPVNITMYAKKGNAVATLKLNTNVQVTPTNVTSSNINRNTFRITGATLNLSTYSVSVSGTWIDPENDTEKPLSIVIPVQLNLLNEIKNLVIQYVGNDVVSTIVESDEFREVVGDEVDNNISRLTTDISTLTQRADLLELNVSTVQTDFTRVDVAASEAKATADEVSTKVAKLEGSNGRNLFGFSKGIRFTNCYPTINDYGFLIITLNSTVTALLGNLGLSGTGGLFVVSFEVLSGGTNIGIEIGFNNSSYLSIVTGTSATWTKKVVYFDEISDSDASLDKLYIRVGNSMDYISFKNFQIERGNIVTPFGISSKDAMNYGNDNLISLGNKTGENVINQTTYDYYSFDTNKVIQLPQLKYKVPYTLSFYAKFNISSSNPAYYSLSGNGTYPIDLHNDNEYNTEIVETPISTSWKKYYIYWYIDNPNFVWDTNNPVELTLFYGESSSNKVTYADIKFQEGYIYEGNETGNSIIRQTADEISATVRGQQETITTLTLNVQGIQGQVTSLNTEIAGKVDQSSLTATANQIRSEVVQIYNDANGYAKFTTVDLRSLSTTKFYPVAVSLPYWQGQNGTGKTPRVSIRVSRLVDINYGGPDYSTHHVEGDQSAALDGFPFTLEFSTMPCGYGNVWPEDSSKDNFGEPIFVNKVEISWTQDINGIPKDYIVPAIYQNYKGSKISGAGNDEIIYLRGGSKYDVESSWAGSTITLYSNDNTGYYWSNGSDSFQKLPMNYDANIGPVLQDQMTRSEIVQTADSIGLHVIEGLKSTGIDIESGKIDLIADNTNIIGNLNLRRTDNGLTVYDSSNQARINIKPQNTPTPTAGDNTFSSKGYVSTNSSQVTKTTTAEINATTSRIYIGLFSSGNSIKMTVYPYIYGLSPQLGYWLENNPQTISCTAKLFTSSTGTTAAYSTTRSISRTTAYGSYVYPSFDWTQNNVSTGSYYFELTITATETSDGSGYSKYTISAGVDFEKLVTSLTYIGLDGILVGSTNNHFAKISKDGFEFRWLGTTEDIFGGSAVKMSNDGFKRVYNFAYDTGPINWVAFDGYTKSTILTDSNTTSASFYYGTTYLTSTRCYLVKGDDVNIFIPQGFSYDIYIRLGDGCGGANSHNALPGRRVCIRNFSNRTVYVCSGNTSSNYYIMNRESNTLYDRLEMGNTFCTFMAIPEYIDDSKITNWCCSQRA